MRFASRIHLTPSRVGCLSLFPRSGEIAEDLANYLADSEQSNSALGLGVALGRDCRVKSAGGFLVQARAAPAASIIMAFAAALLCATASWVAEFVAESASLCRGALRAALWKCYCDVVAALV